MNDLLAALFSMAYLISDCPALSSFRASSSPKLPASGARERIARSGKILRATLQMQFCARFFREILIVNWLAGPVDGWGTMLNGALRC
jgi:hypothetical protein